MASYSGDSKLFLHYLQVSRNPVLLHDFAVLIDIEGILISAIVTCPSEIAIALLFYSHFRSLESTFLVRVYNNSILLFWLFFLPRNVRSIIPLAVQDVVRYFRGQWNRVEVLHIVIILAGHPDLMPRYKSQKNGVHL